jgi:putative ABC transport system permease protein
MYILSRNFIKCVLIANIIAWPAAYFVSKRWLENFAYRIEIPLWIFASAGAAAVLIALLTISYQVNKAARANPANILKYE